MPVPDLIDRLELDRRRRILRYLREVATLLGRPDPGVTSLIATTSRPAVMSCPCLICDRSFPVPVAVDDPTNPVPASVICAECDARSEETPHG